jgi:predicted nucleic acid-binding OB-fold protein
VSLTNQETKSEEESIFVIDFVPKGRREKEKRERERVSVVLNKKIEIKNTTFKKQNSHRLPS